MQKDQQSGGFLVPDDFIELHLKELNEACVKVFLYAKYAAEKNGGTVKCDLLYAAFGDRTYVQEALRTLVSRGCLYVDKNSVISFTEEREQIQRPKYTSAEVTQSLDRDIQLQMLMQAAEQVLGKMLTASAAESLYSMYDWLGLPVEVILKLLEYCVGIGKKSMAYIEKVAITWHKEGITTLEAAQAYLALETQKRTFSYKAKQIFGIDSRNLTSKEESLVSKWQMMGVSEELLQFAFDYTVDNTGKLAFAYMDKVLCAWVEAGALTPQQAQRFIDAYKKAGTADKSAVKKKGEKPGVYGADKYDYEEIRRRARENIRHKIGKE